MSRRLAALMFLKLTFTACMMPQFAFSAGKIETISQPDDRFQRRIATPFERLPLDIAKLIFERLSKKNLLNLRVVNKNLRDKVTPLITNIEIPDNLPNREQVEKFFRDLTKVKFWEGKKPSQAFTNLFCHAPEITLFLHDQEIGARNLVTIAPVFPTTLRLLDLSGNNLGDEGIKVLGPRLPATLKSLFLDRNNIGNVGAQVLAFHFPANLEMLVLFGNNIGDKGFAALLEAVQRKKLKTRLYISTAFNLFLCKQSQNFRN